MSERTQPLQLLFRAHLPLVLLLVGGCTLSLSMEDKQRQAAIARENADSTSNTLKRLLETEDAHVRALVARELADMGPSARDAIPALHAMIEDPDRHVRLEASRALLAIDPMDRVAVPALMMIINDPETSVDDRGAALSMLQTAGPRGQAALALHNSSTSGIVATFAPATQPNRPARPISYDAAAPPRSTDRPVRASDVTPALDRSPALRSAPPATRPALDESSRAPYTPAPGRNLVVASASTTVASTQPAMTPSSPIPGLNGIDTSSAPKADIHLYGLDSYTSTQSNALRQWIDRQPNLSAAEKEQRFNQFNLWRTEQDRRIYQRALEK